MLLIPVCKDEDIWQTGLYTGSPKMTPVNSMWDAPNGVVMEGYLQEAEVTLSRIGTGAGSKLQVEFKKLRKLDPGVQASTPAYKDISQRYHTLRYEHALLDRTCPASTTASTCQRAQREGRGLTGGVRGGAESLLQRVQSLPGNELCWRLRPDGFGKGLHQPGSVARIEKLGIHRQEKEAWIVQVWRTLEENEWHSGSKVSRRGLLCPDELDSLFSYFYTGSGPRSLSSDSGLGGSTDGSTMSLVFGSVVDSVTEEGEEPEESCPAVRWRSKQGDVLDPETGERTPGALHRLTCTTCRHGRGAEARALTHAASEEEEETPRQAGGSWGFDSQVVPARTNTQPEGHERQSPLHHATFGA
ncbi:arf-GAP with coiled-coil, ANK repeat and PH domain-containing protein 3-like isoform X3 [Lates japonicus]|uniref:Arf-GAP with coiled-coil, ANK repeat and PH domain-containing protein 3-like isoform X3 n=1 Tax=Lates japonicus TaxID=270547 RepID=A0AAD3NJ49_LATJO|nr:arf-GAP with coiled-coil, ANK repeat and PH domain-containing protein 3-like isoform X3 [Lates japonicus]